MEARHAGITEWRRLARTAVLLLLAGAGIGDAGEPQPVLRIGTSGDYPAFSRAGEGFDVAVAGLLAAGLGTRIEWVSFRWPELRDRVRGDAFDVAMSGITWRPEREVVGWMSRAVARGGPCVVGAAEPTRVAVNRGGALEAWARRRFDPSTLVLVDDNLSLPEPFAAGKVDAFVTDSFELRYLARSEWPARCEPPRDRKVYWVAPARAADLGPRIDAWLAANEARIDGLRVRWLGGSQPHDPLDHLIDLVARRMELMPSVAAWKRAHGRPIDDPERERAVLARVVEAAGARGLDGAAVRRLFRVLVDLAKAVQRRAPADAPVLDLEVELRPALSRLDERIVTGLAVVVPIFAADLDEGRLGILAPTLTLAEIGELAASLREVSSAQAAAGAG